MVLLSILPYVVFRNFVCLNLILDTCCIYMHIHFSLKRQFKGRKTVDTGATPHVCVRLYVFILTTADGLFRICVILVYPSLCLFCR